MKQMLKKFFSQSHRIWSVHNPLKGWTLHGLTSREASLLLHTLSLAERRVIWVWKQEMPSWVHLDHADCADLREPLHLEPLAAPAIPEMNEEDEITAVHLNISRKTIRYHSRPDRKTVSVPAEIVQGPQIFRTRTENVSESGIKLVDVLPDWVAGYFTVILGLQSGPIEVIAMLVEDQKEAKFRVEIVETEDEESHLPLYRQWVRGLPESALD